MPFYTILFFSPRALNIFRLNLMEQMWGLMGAQRPNAGQCLGHPTNAALVEPIGPAVGPHGYWV